MMSFDCIDNAIDWTHLSLTEMVLDQLVAISERARPREGVAALYGERASDRLNIFGARELANKARSNRQFIIRGDGLDGAMALFHSHPVPRTFSPQDRKQIVCSSIPWVVGFPRCQRRFSDPLLWHEQWMFQAARCDQEKGIQPCNLSIMKEET